MARGVEVHVIHASSVSVPREHRRAKTDRLDMLGKRWPRAKRCNCEEAQEQVLSRDNLDEKSGNQGALIHFRGDP